MATLNNKGGHLIRTSFTLGRFQCDGHVGGSASKNRGSSASDRNHATNYDENADENRHRESSSPTPNELVLQTSPVCTNYGFAAALRRKSQQDSPDEDDYVSHSSNRNNASLINRDNKLLANHGVINNGWVKEENIEVDHDNINKSHPRKASMSGSKSKKSSSSRSKMMRAEIEARLRPEIEAKLKAEIEARLKAEFEARLRPEIERKYKTEIEKNAIAEMEAKAMTKAEARWKRRISEAEGRLEEELKEHREEIEKNAVAETDAETMAKAEARADKEAKVVAEEIEAEAMTRAEAYWKPKVAEAEKRAEAETERRIRAALGQRQELESETENANAIDLPQQRETAVNDEDMEVMEIDEENAPAKVAPDDASTAPKEEASALREEISAPQDISALQDASLAPPDSTVEVEQLDTKRDNAELNNNAEFMTAAPLSLVAVTNATLSSGYALSNAESRDETTTSTLERERSTPSSGDEYAALDFKADNGPEVDTMVLMDVSEDEEKKEKPQRSNYPQKSEMLSETSSLTSKVSAREGRGLDSFGSLTSDSNIQAIGGQCECDEKKKNDSNNNRKKRHRYCNSNNDLRIAYDNLPDENVNNNNNNNKYNNNNNNNEDVVQGIGIGKSLSVKAKTAKGQRQDENRNQTACDCANGDPKLLQDVTRKIGPSPRPSAENKKKSNQDEDSDGDDISAEFGFGYNHGWDGDCPDTESPWLWYRDAVWGCDEWLFDRDVERRRFAAYVREYINERRGGDGVEQKARKPSVNGRITYKQVGGENQEVPRMDVRKKGRVFIVTWSHPKGEHTSYLLVVYPPMTGDKPGGANADCGPCAGEPECLCGTTPIFRRLISGNETEGKFPDSILKRGQSYVIEVVTLDGKREQSLGSSLVTFET